MATRGAPSPAFRIGRRTNATRLPVVVEVPLAPGPLVLATRETRPGAKDLFSTAVTERRARYEFRCPPLLSRAWVFGRLRRKEEGDQFGAVRPRSERCRRNDGMAGSLEEGCARRTGVEVMVMRVVGKGLTGCHVDALPNTDRRSLCIELQTQHEHMRMLRRSALRQPDPHQGETAYDRDRCEDGHQPSHVRSFCVAYVVQHDSGAPGAPAA